MSICESNFKKEKRALNKANGREGGKLVSEPIVPYLTLTCDIQMNCHMPYIEKWNKNIQLHCTKFFFYIKHHKSWTDLLYLNSKKLPRMVLGFCSLLAFRQCCCLKVDTRHNILKQSHKQGAVSRFEPFPDVSPEDAATIPHQMCKAMRRILMPERVGDLTCTCVTVLMANSVVFPFSKNTV